MTYNVAMLKSRDPSSRSCRQELQVNSAAHYGRYMTDWAKRLRGCPRLAQSKGKLPLHPISKAITNDQEDYTAAAARQQEVSQNADRQSRWTSRKVKRRMKKAIKKEN